MLGDTLHICDFLLIVAGGCDAGERLQPPDVEVRFNSVRDVRAYRLLLIGTTLRHACERCRCPERCSANKGPWIVPLSVP